MKKIAFLLMIIGAFAFAKSEEAPQKSEPKQLEMVLILDKSGSMSGLESDTIGGFNSMIDKQKEAGVDAKVTTVLFDTNFKTLHDRADIKKVEKLTNKDYVASGNTALLDAVGDTINKISKVDDIYAKNRAVLFVIITDGQENSSKEYSKAQIKKMISDKQEKYDWEFIFLGANIDAASEAESIGIQRSNAVKYQNNSEGVQKNFEAAAEMSKDMAMDKKSSSKWREKVLEDK
ncbi:vWA domain-containing protein [uncultured Campylobacter sp.]|uniref:vWA domain-containing protein n=1 Tax=uncultured Campylobacter sp. TaxID=218934 RepID=UPI00263180B3|nr:vWA domain-containing protein [uncultured Campylobacter sp.]